MIVRILLAALENSASWCNFVHKRAPNFKTELFISLRFYELWMNFGCLLVAKLLL